MTNPVVRIVVELLWAVAYTLIPAEDASAGVFATGRTSIASAASTQATPSSSRFLDWLASRLTSPPFAPRMIVA